MRASVCLGQPMMHAGFNVTASALVSIDVCEALVAALSLALLDLARL